MNEFDIINQYFKAVNPLDTVKKKSAGKKDLLTLGVGDDCALIQHNDTQSWAISTDTLIAGVHFFNNDDPYFIAQRALGVSLSDLAAMGAKPEFFSLAITLPDKILGNNKQGMNRSEWLEGFSRGLHDFCRDISCRLIGGDTTKGDLSMTLTVMGLVDTDRILARSKAVSGDGVYVSGVLGSAAVALQHIPNQFKHCSADTKEVMHKAFYQPQPRFDLVDIIAAYSKAAIDISDGLIADLQHICDASGVDANIEMNMLPLGEEILQVITQKELQLLALSGGDDYQLCFTVPQIKQKYFEKLIVEKQLDITLIGQIKPVPYGQKPRVNVLLNGCQQDIDIKGYQHFE